MRDLKNLEAHVARELKRAARSGDVMAAADTVDVARVGEVAGVETKRAIAVDGVTETPFVMKNLLSLCCKTLTEMDSSILKAISPLFGLAMFLSVRAGT